MGIAKQRWYIDRWCPQRRSREVRPTIPLLSDTDSTSSPVRCTWLPFSSLPFPTASAFVLLGAEGRRGA
jgi:hypothetical protein